MKLSELARIVFFKGDATVLSADIDEIRVKHAKNIGCLVGDHDFGEREVDEVFVYPSMINIYVKGKEA